MPKNLRVILGRSHQKKRETLELPPADLAELSEDSKFGLPDNVRKRAEDDLRFLLDRKVLSQCDLEAFERYCQHLAMAYEAYEIIKREGVLAPDERGIPRKHPAMQIHRDNSLAALRFAAELGLTPSARVRLNKTDAQAEEDSYAEFRNRRAAG
jgi:P27 family predicted phage terminase small subunit